MELSQKLLQALLFIVLPCLVTITNVFEIGMLAIYGHPILSIVVSMPFCLVAVVTAVNFKQNHANITQEIPSFVLQIWPQFRALQYLSESFETDQDREKAQKTMINASTIQPYLQSLPMAVVNGYLLLSHWPRFEENHVVVAIMASLTVSTFSILTSGVFIGQERIRLQYQGQTSCFQSVLPSLYIFVSFIWTLVFKLTFVFLSERIISEKENVMATDSLNDLLPLKTMLWLGVSIVPHGLVPIALNFAQGQPFSKLGYFPLAFSYISFLTIKRGAASSESGLAKYHVHEIQYNQWIHILTSATYLGFTIGIGAIYVIIPLLLFTTIVLWKYKIWAGLCGIGTIGSIIIVWNSDLKLRECWLYSLVLLLSYLLPIGFFVFENSSPEELDHSEPTDRNGVPNDSQIAPRREELSDSSKSSESNSTDQSQSSTNGDSLHSMNNSTGSLDHFEGDDEEGEDGNGSLGTDLSSSVETTKL